MLTRCHAPSPRRAARDLLAEERIGDDREHHDREEHERRRDVVEERRRRPAAAAASARAAGRDLRCPQARAAPRPQRRAAAAAACSLSPARVRPRRAPRPACRRAPRPHPSASARGIRRFPSSPCTIARLSISCWYQSGSWRLTSPPPSSNALITDGHVLPVQDLVAGHYGLRFWTNSKPKRPLTQRLPRVTSWSSGERDLDDRVVLDVQREVAADAAVRAHGVDLRLLRLVPRARLAQRRTRSSA